MRRRTLRLALLATLLVLVILAGGDHQVGACGPWFPRAIFVLQKHPDFPLEEFAAGKLGVVSTTWARSQLVVAYRYLAARPLAANEQEAVVALWADRLNPDPPQVTKASEVWTRARAAVPGAAPIERLDPFRYLEKTFSSYLNCTADAFATAARTLAARIDHLGASNPAVAEWLRAQDQVFGNCSTPATIPEAPSPTLLPIMRADRQYQIASALFYAGRFEAAEQAFAAVAADRDSPWRPLGRYLQARALIRRSTVDGDRASLARAEALLGQVATDPGEATLQPAARRLLAFVRARTAPVARVQELGAALSKPGAGTDVEQELWDYTVLLDTLEASPDEARARAATIGAAPQYPTLQAMRNGTDLTDWIVTFQGYTGDAPAHSLERWRQTSSEAWLVAALSAAGGTTEWAPSLIAAARKVSPASPAYPTAAYQAARLLIQTGEVDAARATLDDLLPRARKSWRPSAVNAVLAERAALARNLAEFASFSLRQPALVSSDVDPRELPDEIETLTSGKTTRRLPRAQDTATMLADDAAEVINRAMPLSLLIDLAESPDYPPEWQETIGRAAWMRAVALQAPDLATRAARLVARAGGTPSALKLRTLAGNYLAATADADRRFAAVFAALGNPGLSPVVRAGLPRKTPLDQIDIYRDNWWCAEPPSSDDSVKANAAPPSGIFPAQNQRVAAQAEGARLKAAGPAPNYLARQVLDYARAHPADARVPEALALAVRATRFGCTDKETTKWSRAAFTLLHQKYPTTEWAKGTKYYY